MESQSNALLSRSIMSLDKSLYAKTDNLSLVAECFFVPELKEDLNFFNAENVVFSIVNSLFMSLSRTSLPVVSTPTLLDLYKLTKDSNSVELFSSFDGVDLNSLSVTQGQIVFFCQHYKLYLMKHTDTILFLLKEGREYFVVKTSFSHGNIMLSVFDYKVNNFRWYAMSAHKLVVAI